jgi:TRAP transporter TAXI family solute receptor
VFVVTFVVTFFALIGGTPERGFAADLGGLAKMTRISMATGGTAAAMYVIGGGLANVINENIDNLEVTAEVTAATVENLELVGKRECELALANSDFTLWAYKGETPFKEPKNIRAIASLYPSTFHIIVGASSGIENIGDMAGKRIAVGSPGSGNRLNSEKLLGYYGVSFKDIWPYDFSTQESIDALKDNSIDGTIIVTGSPLAALIDLTMTTKVKFLSLEEEMISKMTQEVAYYQRLVLPPKMYGTDRPIITLGSMNSLIVNADEDEDVVYYVTKGIFENLDQVKTIHVLVSDIDVKNVVKTSIPLHSGAERYFKEIGVW